MLSLIDLLKSFFGLDSSRRPPAPVPNRTQVDQPRRQTSAQQTQQDATVPTNSSRRHRTQTRPVTTRSADVKPPSAVDTSPTDATLITGTNSRNYGDADEYLERIQQKINRLAEEFAQGNINREQFQQLFEHYQHERTAIRNWKDSTASAGDWKDISNEGRSIVIRTRHTAKVLGYAIYANESGMPLTTIGDFDIDPDLAVPMLSSYRSATKEIFGGEMRSTEIEGGKWLCFVPGGSTTMLALFTREPAARQLKTMEDLHRLFEKANRRHLASTPIDPDALAFPHASYLGRLQ